MTLLFDLTAVHLVYASAMLAGVMVFEALFLLYARGKTDRTKLNRRLRIMQTTSDRQSILVQLRRERGLSETGRFGFRLAQINRLITQSGIALPLPRLAMFIACGAILAAFVVGVMRTSLVEAISVGLVCVTVLPYLVLAQMRAARRKLFGTQLADAIELIVRSLRAGHPVPVALAMVGREMPDPVGSEFGIVSDEITFGAGLVPAIQNLQDRVGQEDLPLFVTAVTIQAKTGGNLREVLEGLASVIRQRIKMRRKIKAISAEGRLAGLVLTALPPGFLLIITVLAPDFYGEIWGDPMTWYGLGFAGLMLLIGNIFIYRMVNFRY
ncbi:MAG: type II secretion system F family protein, partial [Pseudomonadota bacterium]